ncbi:hypothetical protein NHX12_028899 [Muraenolepis orangiensis]|uniref:Uncharacterized protein n=1 Tax=Muraenolepis orangiensis TaxID=630683 RepID=A0A9Q0D4G6_9TELE|nr:hypothetical protein NHX12_016563 [Muraenolepis orangiensis]KAJ3604157.1 hypothetical protein NHX12_028898 [Muraenolepis orangiensis]KAJ3604158.1 hypothetical protein NHX12_028899 [Muraenolepis orangiensis]
MFHLDSLLGHGYDNDEVYNVELVQSRLSELLAKHWHGMWLSKLPGVYLDMFSQTIPPEAFDKLDTWTHICSVRLRSCRSHGIK